MILPGEPILVPNELSLPLPGFPISRESHDLTPGHTTNHW